MTAKGDLYSCGLNKDGQLALGNYKSRTGFQHITCFAGLNVQKVCAAGNHSWFQVDEFLPVKGNYQWPAPLKSVQEATLKKASAADKTRRGGAQDNEAPKGKKAREKSSDAGAAGKSSALSKSGPAGARGAGASAAGRMADTNLPE